VITARPPLVDARSRKGSRVSVLVFGDKVAGYANYGRNRARSLHFEGEIYGLSAAGISRPRLRPRLFTAARPTVAEAPEEPWWSGPLSDNDTATSSTRRSAAYVARSSEKFGPSRSTSRLRLDQLNPAGFRSTRNQPWPATASV